MPRLASQVIGQISLLYRLEEKFAAAPAEARQQARQQFSLPIMNGIKAWLDQHRDKVLPKSLLGQAITYALNQWDSLTVYLGNGELSIGRVKMWRGNRKSGLSVSAPFVWRCPNNQAIAPFPHPAHRTRRADFPHRALFQNFQTFAFERSALQDDRRISPHCS